MIVPPCKDCPDRVLSCHSNCTNLSDKKKTEYADYKEEIAAAKKREDEYYSWYESRVISKSSRKKCIDKRRKGML